MLDQGSCFPQILVSPYQTQKFEPLGPLFLLHRHELINHMYYFLSAASEHSQYCASKTLLPPPSLEDVAVNGKSQIVLYK